MNSSSGSDDLFTEAGLRSIRAVSAALEVIVDDHEPKHWHAALAVYVGSAIRAARREQGMPLETAQMLVTAIHNFALGDENVADA